METCATEVASSCLAMVSRSWLLMVDYLMNDGCNIYNNHLIPSIHFNLLHSSLFCLRLFLVVSFLFYYFIILLFYCIWNKWKHCPKANMGVLLHGTPWTTSNQIVNKYRSSMIYNTNSNSNSRSSSNITLTNSTLMHAFWMTFPAFFPKYYFSTKLIWSCNILQKNVYLRCTASWVTFRDSVNPER